MSGQALGLVVSVFLASAVEAVEAVTIVLAMGSTRDWSSALWGAVASCLILAAVIAGLGPAITSLPIDVLRLVVGGLLLAFGLQWLRKAILRASGLKATHDEDEEFRAQAAAASAAGEVREGFDAYAFTISFKGVFLEGLEVAFIVLTFGANQHRIGLAAGAGLLAVSVVATAAIMVRRPLSQVPENTMKFAVGVMLTSFGVFWGSEGAGAHWPAGDAALLVVAPCVLGLSLGLVVGARYLLSRSDQIEPTKDALIPS
jgi:uncharacterized membrane protein